MKRIIRVLLFLVLITLPIISYSEQVNIYVLNTGDIHESSKNLAAIKNFVTAQRKAHSDRIILVDVGDLLTQYPFPEQLLKKIARLEIWLLKLQREQIYLNGPRTCNIRQ